MLAMGCWQWDAAASTVLGTASCGVSRALSLSFSRNERACAGREDSMHGQVPFTADGAKDCAVA